MRELPYYSYKTYMKSKYNEALYSIPIDLDLGCPNRKSDKSNGCTFCPQNGARAAQTLSANNIKEQIKNAINFSKKRYKAKKFMLYIQAYTGTFTSIIKQKEIYSKLLRDYKFDAISIGTRPDCLNQATLEYLKELNKQLDVHIDLGVQTLNDITLKQINRGHNAKCSIDAIKRIKKYDLKVFAHIIIGLKNETRKDFLNTVKTLCELNIDGIKIHNLHIIKNTQLHKEFLKIPFKVYNEYEYANELVYLIRNIPLNIPIIRISTDTPKKDLIAPKWEMQKGQFSDYVEEKMLLGDFRQADLIQEVSLKKKKLNEFKLEDGSFTIWDKKYKDFYHPKSGAIKQAKELFIKQSDIENKLEKKEINLLDIGFGMGYNSLELIKLDKKHKLFITALDKNRSIIKYTASKMKDNKILNEIYENYTYEDIKNKLDFILDDARYSIQKLDKKFDIIFLDPFCATQNPSLITTDFVKIISKILKKDGILIASNCSEFFKSALSLNGFKYEDFSIERSDIKGLIIKFGESCSKIEPLKDKNLILKEKQILINH